MRSDKGLSADREKARAWQERSARKYQERQRAAAESGERGPKRITPKSRERRAKAPKRRQNDAPWRAAVIELRGEWCRSCGTSRDLQADHVLPRAQGGTSVVENGTMLCRTCHDGKTAGSLQYRRDWLDEDQIEWLAEQGWVRWDSDGQTSGYGFRRFASEKRGGEHE